MYHYSFSIVHPVLRYENAENSNTPCDYWQYNPTLPTIEIYLIMRFNEKEKYLKSKKKTLKSKIEKKINIRKTNNLRKEVKIRRKNRKFDGQQNSEVRRKNWTWIENSKKKNRKFDGRIENSTIGFNIREKKESKFEKKNWKFDKKI